LTAWHGREHRPCHGRGWPAPKALSKRRFNSAPGMISPRRPPPGRATTGLSEPAPTTNVSAGQWLTAGSRAASCKHQIYDQHARQHTGSAAWTPRW
jgi:hypothetical protein